MKRIAIWTLAIAIVSLMIAFSDNAIEYARYSMQICCEMIVPTLFPFFICSGILVYSGFCETLSRMFRFCMRPLFGVSPAGAAAFVLGIVSGYPLGAVTAGQLYESGYLTQTEAERLCAFCNNSGPLFIIGSVGAAIYGNITFGVMIYILHIIASLTVGIIFRFYKKSSYTAPPTVMTAPARSVGEIISISLNNAVSTMLTVCGAVVFFGMAGRLILDLLPIEGGVYALAAGVLEFVNGTMAVSTLDIEMSEKLIMTAFIVGFAGFSVHAQVIAVIARYRFSLLPYFVGKLLHGLIAALYTLVYMKIFPITEVAFAPSMGKAFFAVSLYLIIPAVSMMTASVGVIGIKIRRYMRKGVKE